MPSVQDVSALIGAIYEAAVDARAWPRFLQAFADAVGGASTHLLYHDLRDNRGGLTTSIRLDSDAARQYDEYFVRTDPWIRAGKVAGGLVPGRVHIGESLVPRHEMLHTEYYNDFARHYGVTRTLAAVIRQDEKTISSISTMRGDAAEPFGEAERALLELLMPHLQRALTVHRRLCGLELANTALVEALERLPIGVIVTRATASIEFTNRAADAILGAADGLAATQSQLTASLPADNRTLRALIHAAAATSGGQGSGSGGALSISRPSSARPLSVLVTPLRARTLDGLDPGRGLAAVFVTDPEAHTELDVDTLQRLWGLTPAEAAVACRLASGENLRDIADALAVTHNTVRWHVKHVLSKTQTGRQADLVRLLITSAARVQRG